MILTCPACNTRFLVPDAAFIGRTVRRVRCGKCRHEWMADAPATADFASMLQQATPELTPAAEIAPKPIPQGSNLPVKIRRRWLQDLKAKNRTSALVALGLMLLLVALAGIAPAALTWLGSIINATQAPRLTIENVTTRYVTQTAAAAEAGATVPDALGNATPTGWSLVVEGTIKNQSNDDETVPPLRVMTKDAKGALLGTYRPSVQLQTLPPHGETSFTLPLGAADANMAEVTVQFAAE